MNKIETICLNSLRFFAAGIIAFAWHYQQHFLPEYGSPFASVLFWSYRYGWLMVELFFTLSGFGMFLGYASKIQAHQISFPQYILKRLRKIYPLFLLTLFLVTGLESWHIVQTGETFVYPNFDFWHFFINLILCQNGIFGSEQSFNSPSWCISICFVMYIIFYAVMYLVKDQKQAIRIFAVMSFLGIAVHIKGIEFPFVLNTLTARGVTCFSIGAILGYIHTHCDRLNTVRIGYTSLAAIALLYVIFRLEESFFGNLEDIQHLFMILISPAIIWSVLYVPWLNKLFSMQFLQYLGSLSVPIYLFHFAVQCAIRDIELALHANLNYSDRLVWLLYTAAVLLTAACYNRFLSASAGQAFDAALRKLKKPEQ